MSNSIIDRDEDQQKAFGEALVNFENEMSRCCKTLKNRIQDASDNIKGENARVALEYLVSLVEEIENELPGIQEFGTRQIKLARHIEDASNFKFSR